MDTYQGQLVGGEIRHGKVGFFCASGRKHVFLHLFQDGGTGMDIGPCEGESCPYARTHGLIGCNSCKRGSLSCLESRHITLNKRCPETYMLPVGRKRGCLQCCIVTAKGGGLEPDWCRRLAEDAEAVDRLTGDWPSDWRRCQCEASERGHHWYYTDDNGFELGKDADGRNFGCWDADPDPDFIAQAAQRRCLSCGAVTQMKRADGEWSEDRNGCTCCTELPSEHSQYHCARCEHDKRSVNFIPILRISYNEAALARRA